MIILDYYHPVIKQAMTKSAEIASVFEVSTTIEIEMAEIINQFIPSIKIVSMVTQVQKLQ